MILELPNRKREAKNFWKSFIIIYLISDLYHIHIFTLSINHLILIILYISASAIFTEGYAIFLPAFLTNKTSHLSILHPAIYQYMYLSRPFIHLSAINKMAIFPSNPCIHLSIGLSCYPYRHSSTNLSLFSPTHLMHLYF